MVFFLASVTGFSQQSTLLSDDELFRDLDQSIRSEKKGSSDDDLFKELDQETVPGVSSETGVAASPRGRVRSFFEDIAHNAEFKLSNRMMIYYEKPPHRDKIDRRGLVDEGWFEFSTKLKRGAELFSVAGWAMIGSQKDTYTQRNYYYGADRTRFLLQRQRRFF